ncbi:MAG: hypothetical protein OEW83_16025, partial [Acidimicrobiia bacterium]|nr:hypothetical protein [Acidimicrobiia bacterium]
VIAGLAGGRDGKPRALVVEDGLVLGIISPSDIIRRHSIADLMGPALADRVEHPRPAPGGPTS